MGLARARVVCEQEPETGLRQHLHVNRFDLVRQCANTREAHRKLTVVGVG